MPMVKADIIQGVPPLVRGVTGVTGLEIALPWSGVMTRARRPEVVRALLAPLIHNGNTRHRRMAIASDRRSVASAVKSRPAASAVSVIASARGSGMRRLF